MMGQISCRVDMACTSHLWLADTSATTSPRGPAPRMIMGPYHSSKVGRFHDKVSHSPEHSDVTIFKLRTPHMTIVSMA